MQRATVWSHDCGKVKLRSEPNKSCDMYWDIPTGTSVDVIDSGDEWSKIAMGGHTGYIQTKYLVLGEMLFNTENDTITVNRKQLKSVYDELGDILGIPK